MRPMCRVQRAIAESVISALERNDTAVARGQHRCFERRFDRFKPGITKKRFARIGILDFGFGHFPGPPLKGDSAQFARQFRLERVRMDVAHRVWQFSHLPLTGLHHARIRVSGRSDPEGRRKVEIFISVGIPNLRAAGTFPHDGPGTIRFNERHVARFKALELFENLTGAHLKLNASRLDAPLVRQPDELVHLELKADGQSVGDDFLDEFQAGDGLLIARNFF